jgi:hypothetical protein
MEGGGTKENDGGGKFKCDVFDIRTFVSATMYSYAAQLKKEKIVEHSFNL